MTNINIEISEKYREHLDLLKQVIPDEQGGEITSDGKMLEVLIDSFMHFIQEQAAAHSHAEGGCCGGGGCGGHGHEHGEGGCGCSH